MPEEQDPSVWGDEKILENDGGDGYRTVWIYVMPLNCILKRVTLVNFVTLKKKKKETFHYLPWEGLGNGPCHSKQNNIIRIKAAALPFC